MDINITDKIVSAANELAFSEEITSVEDLESACYSKAEGLICKDSFFSEGYTPEDINEVSQLLYNQTIAVMQLIVNNDEI